MAYKFQFGTTKLSGSTTFEEAVVGESTISGSGIISGLRLVLDPSSGGAVGSIGISSDTNLIGLEDELVTVKGRLTTDDATDATSKTDGSLQTDGGLGVAKAIYNGTAATLAADSGVVTIGSSNAATFSADGKLNINSTVEATTTGDGSLQTDGGLSVVKSAVIGDDLDLLSNAAIFKVGSDQPFTLTHANSNNTLLATTDHRLAFGTNDEYISGDGNDLKLVSSRNVVVTGDVTGSGAITMGGALDVGNSRLIVNESLILGTTALHASGTFFSENALVVGDLAANQSRVAYFDMKGGDIKTCDFSVYASLLAGTGITATDGVLSVDTTGGDSMSSTIINYVEASNDGFTLTAGLNWFGQAHSGSTTLTLPSGSAGDVVIVKASSGASTTSYIKITSSMGNKNQIDGFSEARIESPHGAVSLIYSETGYGQWVLY